jgi:membrane-bound lytic murein transglycosylase B
MFKRLLAVIFITMLVISPLAGVENLRAQSDLSSEQRAQLESELRVLEQEIAQKEAELAKQRGQTGSIQKDINVLVSDINRAKLQIQAKNLIITKLSKEINSRVSKINNLDQKISSGQDSISDLIRKTRELDNTSIAHVLLSNQTVSEFYHDMDAFEIIKGALREHVGTVQEAKTDTEIEKKGLEKDKNKQVDAKVTIESEKKKVERNEQEKKKLLTISKQQETAYQKELAARQKRKSEILSALFKLRDSGAIKFGDALTYAKSASAKTGVRPALILAIITQESNLGANVGTCNKAGQPESKSWRKIMPGPDDKAAKRSGRDDQTPYLAIVKSLGLDPDTTPLSCPIAGGGWGGAMGPSQFIPTTWISYQSKIANALGKSTASPWNAEDAFMATALYLANSGAANAGYSAERNAACRYYSGAACKDGRKPPNSFYGNSVMAIATKIQGQIDELQGLQ